MDLKFFIWLLYFERQNMVRNALNSIKDLDYSNWELFITDDGSLKPIEPVVNEVLADYKDKFSILQTGHYSVEDKWKNLSLIGMYANQAIAQSNSDVVLILCDDDALTHDYLNNLNKFYNENPEENWAYCHVVEYDPFNEIPDRNLLEAKRNQPFWHNRNLGATLEKVTCVLDSSQVSFRTKVFREGVQFHYPRTGLLDAAIYQEMTTRYGKPCKYIGSIGQYKAVFPDQMGKRIQDIRGLTVKDKT